MKVIKQSVNILGEVPTEFIPAMKWIERAGRTCYQSFDKITDDSWKQFISNCIKRGHLSILEHSDIIRDRATYTSPYLKDDLNITYGNIRAFIEATGVLKMTDDPLEYIKMWYDQQSSWLKQRPNFKHPDPMITVKMSTNRAMLAEITRHRPASFSVLSQRYVRGNIIFIEPVQYKAWSQDIRERFFDGLDYAETLYNYMIKRGCSPQEARNVLPNTTATEIVMTTRKSHWDWIFELRCSETADPQMRNLIEMVKSEFYPTSRKGQ